MATFYSNRKANSSAARQYRPAVPNETVMSVLRKKNLEVVTLPGFMKKAWKDGMQKSPNTPLAEMLAGNYSRTEPVHQELRKIASSSSRYGLITYHTAGVSRGELSMILNSMQMQGLLESSNSYSTGVYVTLAPGAGEFLKKDFATLHVVKALKDFYGANLQEIKYDCKLCDVHTGQQYGVDVIYRVGSSVNFVNITLNANFLGMNNYLTRHATIAERLRSSYGIVVSPNVNPVTVKTAIRERTSFRCEPVQVACFDRLEYLTKRN